MNQQLSFKLAEDMGSPVPEGKATAEALAAAAAASSGGMASPPPLAGGGQGGKVAAQLNKMKEANAKYKNLLKLAKERIQTQEDELKRLRAEADERAKQLEREEKTAQSNMAVDDGDVVGDSAEHTCNIVRVCQRIKVELEAHETPPSRPGQTDEIWALLEFETINPDQPELLSSSAAKRTKKWKKFDSEHDLQDFIRRDTGEPLVIPPYSLTPQQSASIEKDSAQKVSQITEEFRRFRVKSEMARKQTDAQLRELQNKSMKSAQLEIDRPQDSSTTNGTDTKKRSEQSQIERLRSEMAQQEAQWKEAYEILEAENKTLKSSGSEALLASQWRKRYESLKDETKDLEAQLKMEKQKTEMMESDKYEAKYRDLKESFRLYRKKAKEIFEAQSNGDPNQAFLAVADKTGEENKLDYLKNLMVNYLTSDFEVREHMESAIGTVLQFTPEDIEKINAKKAEGDYWGIF